MIIKLISTALLLIFLWWFISYFLRRKGHLESGAESGAQEHKAKASSSSTLESNTGDRFKAKIRQFSFFDIPKVFTQPHLMQANSSVIMSRDEKSRDGKQHELNNEHQLQVRSNSRLSGQSAHAASSSASLDQNSDNHKNNVNHTDGAPNKEQAALTSNGAKPSASVDTPNSVKSGLNPSINRTETTETTHSAQTAETAETAETANKTGLSTDHQRTHGLSQSNTKNANNSVDHGNARIAAGRTSHSAGLSAAAVADALSDEDDSSSGTGDNDSRSPTIRTPETKASRKKGEIYEAKTRRCGSNVERRADKPTTGVTTLEDQDHAERKHSRSLHDGEHEIKASSPPARRQPKQTEPLSDQAGFSKKPGQEQAATRMQSGSFSAVNTRSTERVMKPQELSTARAEQDDLKLIKGIGKVMEKTLHNYGVTTFKQLGEFNKDDVERVSETLSVFPGRIERDNWVSQARDQYCSKYGKSLD